MARKVAWTENAWEDLEAAAEYIARDSANYAAVFVDDVKEAAGIGGEGVQHDSPSRTKIHGSNHRAWFDHRGGLR